jgi:hypothetical protein
VVLVARAVVPVASAQPMYKSNFPLFYYYNQNGLKQGRRTASVAQKFDRQLRQLSAHCALSHLFHARLQSVFVSVSEGLVQAVHGIGTE